MFGVGIVKNKQPVWAWDAKIDCIIKMSMWNKWVFDFLYGSTNSGKLINKSMNFGQVWSKITMALLFMRPKNLQYLKGNA